MARKVFEAIAELNIKDWLANLQQLETATVKTGGVIISIFEKVEAAAKTAAASLNSINSSFQGLKAAADFVSTTKRATEELKTAASEQRSYFEALARARQAAAEADRIAQEQANKDRKTLLARMQAEELSQIEAFGRLRAARAITNYEQEIRSLREAVREQVSIREQAYREIAALEEKLAAAIQKGGRVDDIRAAIEAQKQAAAKATEFQIALEKDLTDRVEAETKIRISAARRFGLSIEEAQKLSNRPGWLIYLSEELEKVSRKIKTVEDDFNSLFRAGAQITQIGSMMFDFARRVSLVGQELIASAGNFDFWIARAVAATKAANEQFGATTNEVIVNSEQFKKYALEVGRLIGVLTPEEIGKTWFDYQAALGETITKTEDLATAQRNLETITKAAVMTNTDAGTAIRGVSGAIGQFALEAQDASYVTAVLTNATQVSMAEFSDLLQTFKYVGPHARRLGMDIGDVATVTVTLADAGIRGTQAGRLFSSGLAALSKTSADADKALQALFITSRGLDGSWRDILYSGGQLRPLFNYIDKDGREVTGVLYEFSQALRNVAPADRERFFTTVFGRDAAKVWATLISEYDRAVIEAERASGKVINALDEVAARFKDPRTQLQLFNDQWNEVADSSKVKWGQLTFLVSEIKSLLGGLLVDALLPAAGWIRNIADAISNWAAQNPALATSLFQVAAGIVAVMAAGGALFMGFGSFLSAFAALPVLLTAISGGFQLLGATVATAFMALGEGATVLAGITGGFGGLVIVLGLLAAAWFTNFGGIRDVTADVVSAIQSMLDGLRWSLEGFGPLLVGLLTGNRDQIIAGAQQIAAGVIEAFVILPSQVEIAFGNVFVTIADYLLGMADAAYNWGANLMASFAEGLWAAAVWVWDAAASIAAGVAAYFESFSPPKVGPLRRIDEWGKNLAKTFAEGFRSGDISAVEEGAERIAAAIQRRVKAGLFGAEGETAAVEGAYNLFDDMLEIIRGGGRVSGEFFGNLLPALGEWYEYIVQISLAYQEVYANDRALANEKKKLDLLRAQREELERAYDKRIKEFDAAAGEFELYEQYAGEAVDPLTPEGKAAIARMKRELSREDFQNWLAFQKKLWEQKRNLETQTLEQQEESVQTQIKLIEAQLDAAKEQYNYYVKVYELAVKLYELARKEEAEAERAVRGGGGGGGRTAAAAAGTAAISKYGTPQDYQRYLEEIRRIIGEEGAILDEDELLKRRAQDYIGAFSDAEKQRVAEKARLDELEKANRKKRAQYEVDLINATSEEERKRIKSELDAWDAAYKQEKTRLQERIQLVNEIAAAAKQAAEATAPERIAKKEAEYQREIRDLLGEQVEVIEDSTRLKELGGSLERAALLAKEQQTREERKLRDLQAAGDQKRLEFERRIREAANDPERLMRIREEQAAWEAAYKQALEAQQARLEAARRAAQDIAQLKAEAALAEREQREAESAAGRARRGGGAGRGGAGRALPTFERGGWGPEEYLEQIEQAKRRARDYLRDVERPTLPRVEPREPPQLRPSQIKALETLDAVTRAVKYLTDSQIPLQERLARLGEATLAYIRNILGQSKEQNKWLEDFWKKNYKPFDWKSVFTAPGGVGPFSTNLLPVITGQIPKVDIVGAFVRAFGALDFNRLFTEDVKRALGSQPLLTIFKNALLGKPLQAIADSPEIQQAIQRSWEGIKEKIKFWWGKWQSELSFEDVGENSLQAKIARWWRSLPDKLNLDDDDTFLGKLKNWWDRIKQNYKELTDVEFTKQGLFSVAEWGAVFSGLQSTFDTFSGGLRGGWDNLWSGLTGGWDTFKQTVLTGWGATFGAFSETLSSSWETFWATLTGGWETFKGNVSQNWETFWATLSGGWETFKGNVSQSWETFWATLTNGWETFKGNVSRGWETFWATLTGGWETFKGNVSQNWETFWATLSGGWETFKESVVQSSETFWATLTNGWETFKGNVSRGWETFWATLTGGWETFKGNVSRSWEEFWATLTNGWTTFKTLLETGWAAFFNSVLSSFSGFVSAVTERYNALKDNVTAALETVASTIGGAAERAANAIRRVGDAIGNIAGGIGGAVDAILDAARRIFSWRPPSTGGGGGGGGSGGSYASGLRYVPYDEFIATLHKGERILTAAEAALYNELERRGLLDFLRNLPQTVAKTTNAAIAPQYVVSYAEAQTKKVVNVSIGQITANTPDTAKTLVKQLSKF